jgi:hypothetical protein
MKTTEELRVATAPASPQGLDVREIPLLPRWEKCFLLTSPFIEPATRRKWRKAPPYRQKKAVERGTQMSRQFVGRATGPRNSACGASYQWHPADLSRA